INYLQLSLSRRSHDSSTKRTWGHARFLPNNVSAEVQMRKTRRPKVRQNTDLLPYRPTAGSLRLIICFDAFFREAAESSGEPLRSSVPFYMA
ncbi:hypothetical protein NPIL_95381, partial [Nephila pilipes]